MATSLNCVIKDKCLKKLYYGFIFRHVIIILVLYTYVCCFLFYVIVLVLCFVLVLHFVLVIICMQYIVAMYCSPARKNDFRGA